MVKKSAMPTPNAGSPPPVVHRAPAKGTTPSGPGTITRPSDADASSSPQSVITTAALVHGTVTGSGHGASSGGGGNSGK